MSISLSNSIYTLCQRFNYQLKFKNQRISLDIDSCLPEILYGDLDQLDRALSKIIDNAIKYSPDNATIEIKALLESKANSKIWAHFEVIDSGPGIPQEKGYAIFAPFIQGDDVQYLTFEGSGLGLSVARDIIIGLGGELWYRNNKDINIDTDKKTNATKGATFHVLVPLYEFPIE